MAITSWFILIGWPLFFSAIIQDRTNKLPDVKDIYTIFCAKIFSKYACQLYIISMLHAIYCVYSNGSKSNLSHISLFTHGPKHVFNVPVCASMRTWELFIRVLKKNILLFLALILYVQICFSKSVMATVSVMGNMYLGKYK